MSNQLSTQHPQDILKDDDEISLLDLLGTIADNLRLLVIGPIVAGLIGLTYAFTLTPIFTAKTTIIPPGQNTSGGGAAALLGQLGGLGVLAGAGGAGASIKTPADQYIAYLESNTLQDQLIDQFKLMERYEAKYHEVARATLKGNSKITAEKKSGLISIEVSDPDPQFAANLANAYVSALSQMLGKMALEDAKFRRQLLEQQINEATEKSYRSPLVREAIIQSIVREYETAILDQKKDRPYIQQVDVAEVPELKSKPKRAQIAIIAALISSFFLLIYIFLISSIQNAKSNPITKYRVQDIVMKLRKQLHW
jgi:uncharacterized protein involved in exopolysaccharide biosynthesis